MAALQLSSLSEQVEKAKEHAAGGVDGGLESALLDQRMRADRHKANFDALKAQHLALQEKYQTMRLDHDTVADSYDRLHHKSQEIIQKLQSERDSKILECENLRKQSVTGLRLEQLKLQLAEEIEEPFRKRTETAELELETLRSEYNRLRYNCSFLKSQYDSMEMTHKSEVEELVAKHRVEVSALMEERKKLLSRRERDIPTDLQRIRQLERDNGELQQRVKSLISENEELRAEKETIGEQSKQSLQVNSRQLAELQALNKTLDLERTSLLSQTQSLQQELSTSYQQHQTLNEKLSQEQRQLVACTRKLEDAEHKHSMTCGEMKMKHAEHVRELEQERERCMSEHSLCQAQLETVTRTVQEQDMLLASKEQQVEQRVQVAREKEWEKQVLLEKEKVEVEERLAELQRIQASSAEEFKVKIDQLEAALAQLQTEKGQVELELEMTSKRLQEKDSELLSLNNEVQQLSKMSKKYQGLYTEHRSLQQSSVQLRESGKKLEQTVGHLEAELSRSRQETLQLQEAHQQVLEKERQCWLEEKDTLHKRIEEWQTSQQNTSQKLEESRKEARKLQKHYKRKIEELNQAQSLQLAELDKISSERAATITALNLENSKLNSRLAEHHRKRKEFMFFLQNSPQTIIPQLAQQPQEDRAHTADLKQMSERMDTLEANQDMQLLQQNLTLTATASRTNHQDHLLLPISPASTPSGDV